MSLLTIEFYTETQQAAQELAALFEGHFDSLSFFESGQRWMFSAAHQVADKYQKEAIETFIKESAVALNHEIQELAVQEAEEKDWLVENRKSFPPIEEGRFFVYNSYYDGDVPASSVAIHINAATAFGSGSHETTSGCLKAIDDLYNQHHAFKNILDMGCGSGILAIAAAKTWDSRVIATDNDPEASKVTQENVLKNNAQNSVTVLCGDGYKEISDTFDLIIANILAKPLCDMAPELASHLEKGGYAILSGILNEQATSVIDAHLRQGLMLEKHFSKGDWTILILKK